MSQSVRSIQGDMRIALGQPISDISVHRDHFTAGREEAFDTESRRATLFLPTDHDRLTILNKIKIVATNVQSETMEDLLSKSKVVMMGERHLTKSDHLNIATVINSFDSLRVRLLLEGNQAPDSWSIYPEIKDRVIVVQAKSWDSQIAIDEYMQFCFENFFPILYSGINLLAYWSQFIRRSPIDPKAADFLICCDDTAKIVNGKYVITLNSFEKAASAWTEQCQKSSELFEKMIGRAFFERNACLVETVEQEVKKTPEDTVIVVIAGSQHIVRSEKHRTAVEYVHSKMMESSIPFVILDPTDSLLNNDDDRSSFFQKQRDEILTKKTIYPLSKIDPLIQELNSKYVNGMQINVAALECELLRLFPLILSLEHIKETIEEKKQTKSLA